MPRVASLAAALALTLSATRGFCQQVSDPTRVEFGPSPDHNVILVSGQSAVASYAIELYLQGAASPFQTNSLGKPNPDSDGVIRVNLTSLFAGWPIPGTVYVSDVATIGPGGQTASTRSNPFAFSTQCAAIVTPLAVGVTGAGGLATAAVSAPASCAWTASTNVPWITISAGATGTGKATVSYSIGANPSTVASRMGMLTIAGQTVIITQGAAPPPTPTGVRIIQ
jgi:hypothetical protein